MTKRPPTLLSTLTVVLFLTACQQTVSTPPAAPESQSSPPPAVMEEQSSAPAVQEQSAVSSEESAGEGPRSAAGEPTGEDEGGDGVQGPVQGDTDAQVDIDEDEPSPRIITMTVESFKFTPALIIVRKGEKVKIRLSGLSGSHGFAIADLGVNTAIAAGKTVDVELPTDRAGTFTFFCSIPCGSGHRDMKGALTITE